MTAPYATRAQLVRAGRRRTSILVAAFPLRAGGEVLFQLADAPGLRRGGVYLLPPGSDAGRAPRFDELFLDLGAKAAVPDLGPTVAGLLARAQRAARAAHARPSPTALGRVATLARAGARVDARLARTGPPPGLPVEALVVTFLLLFVSEEERYPRPRYSGSDLALGRALERLGGTGRPVLERTRRRGPA